LTNVQLPINSVQNHNSFFNQRSKRKQVAIKGIAKASPISGFKVPPKANLVVLGGDHAGITKRLKIYKIK
jgi:hypothetical protein